MIKRVLKSDRETVLLIRDRVNNPRCHLTMRNFLIETKEPKLRNQAFGEIHLDFNNILNKSFYENQIKITKEN